MSASGAKRRKFNPPVLHYKDRVVLDDDYEVVSERSGFQATRFPALGTTWKVGMSWLPEDDEDLALDQDGSWYDIEMEGEVMDSQVRQDQEALSSKTPHLKQKRLRSETALRPNLAWKKKCRSEYLDELLRWEGRGDFRGEDICPDCVSRKRPTPGLCEYRCRSCFLADLVCKECCVKRHRQQPFHIIEKWTGTTFEKASLADIGLEIHLNHASLRCPAPESAHVNLLILHTNGIHKANVKYCGCHRSIPREVQLLRRGLYPASQVSTRTCATFDLLQVLHMFMLTSKLSVYDSYRALERLTNNIGIKLSNRRYRPLLRMTLQWRHLKMLKRGGRAHQLSGVEGTEEGELAIQCPTCPHPGVNIPNDWRDAPDDMKFLYMMILCMDANFRLKNQLVSNYSTDPGLGTGWSYMVTRKPYEEYVLSQADEDDISSCVGFQAMSQSVTRFSRGLRYTGVGGVFCARSDMVLPNGVGNLQKGERYANMDMVFASAIRGTQLAMIAISYDIVCQWFIHLFERMSGWPERLRLPETTSLRPLIPKFHEPAHNEKDHEQYSCNLAEGVGKCDCEGCERFWAGHNAVGNATKTQGPGSRQDVLDDHFGFWNWEKYTGTGLTLLRRYLAAIIERNRQAEAHRGFTDSLSSGVIQDWEKTCKEWDRDIFPKTVENPYKVEGLHLDGAEDTRSKAQGFKVNATSPSVFIAIGLDLEGSQRRVANIAKEQGKIPTNIQTSELRDQRSILRKKILQWEPLRSVYMPGLIQYLAERPDQSVSWEADPPPESVCLHLPSQIDSNARSNVCVAGLPEIEEALRTAQCQDTLDALRHTLRVKARMVYFKNKNVRGQRGSTRSRDIIDRIHKKALIQVTKYRVSRTAKLALCTEYTWEMVLQPLLDRDVRSYSDPEQKKKPGWRKGIWEDGQQPDPMGGEEEEEEEEEEEDNEQTEEILGDDLPASLHARRKKLRKEGTGRTKQTVSWIWRNTAIAINEDDTVRQESDILRSEWARSRARARRSREEVIFLVEEMRRSLEFMEARACWWEGLKQIRDDVSPALAEGLAAYASNQAHVQRTLGISFTSLWKTPLGKMEQLGHDYDQEPENENLEDDEDDDMDDVDIREGGIDAMDVDS